MEESIPYLSIGNDELADNPVLNAKDQILCPHCSSPHTVKSSFGEKNTYTCLMYYNCGGKTYLCGIDNKALANVKKA